jgi:hypothetical protein
MLDSQAAGAGILQQRGSDLCRRGATRKTSELLFPILLFPLFPENRCPGFQRHRRAGAAPGFSSRCLAPAGMKVDWFSRRRKVSLGGDL